MFDKTKPLKRPGLVHLSMYVILKFFLHFRGMHLKYITYSISLTSNLANQSLRENSVLLLHSPST